MLICIDNPAFDCLNAPVSEEEIINSLKNTKNKKAVGSDGVSSLNIVTAT